MFSLRLLPLTALVACGLAPTWEGMEPADPAPVGSPELRAYKETHYRAMGERLVDTLSPPQFMRRLTNSDLLLLGDRHGEEALHRAQLRILADLAAAAELIDWPIRLCLEAVGLQDQPNLDLYMRGEIELDELRTRIAERWPESWLENDGLDQDFYLKLLRFAREHCASLHALESTPRPALARRDALMAERLDELRDGTNQFIVAVVGHVHLCGKGHLLDRLQPPVVAVGARPSRALQRELDDREPPADEIWFEETDRGLLLFAPSLLR